MMYFDFEAGNKAYKLRLTTKAVMNLESKIGCNPVAIFGLDGNKPRIPTQTEMVHILHNSLTHFNHGITLNDAINIFDAWLADGHQPMEFCEVINEIYRASGIYKTESQAEDEGEEGDEKN